MSIALVRTGSDEITTLGDPRMQGDLCYNGYWGTYSIILRVDRYETGHMKWVAQLNLQLPNESLERGTVNFREHCTAWDHRRDILVASRVISISDRDSGGFHGYKSHDDFVSFAREVAIGHAMTRAARRV